MAQAGSNAEVLAFARRRVRLIHDAIDPGRVIGEPCSKHLNEGLSYPIELIQFDRERLYRDYECTFGYI